ncbi:hypothetical protein [Oceanivirga salmonicida]|uniref:hypothetical protein n=1 Tax=Oceanivirga salmonicida TaxID=1769291 RepID=UPI00082CBD13|nr:hypothetical protein [Oceanivirga salmonicida]
MKLNKINLFLKNVNNYLEILKRIIIIISFIIILILLLFGISLKLLLFIILLKLFFDRYYKYINYSKKNEIFKIVKDFFQIIFLIILLYRLKEYPKIMLETKNINIVLIRNSIIEIKDYDTIIYYLNNIKFLFELGMLFIFILVEIFFNKILSDINKKEEELFIANNISNINNIGDFIENEKIIKN